MILIKLNIHVPTWPWFLTGVTAPSVRQSKLSGKSFGSNFGVFKILVIFM